jgi:hypothetical protein
MALNLITLEMHGAEVSVAPSDFNSTRRMAEAIFGLTTGSNEDADFLRDAQWALNRAVVLVAQLQREERERPR